MWWHVVGVCGVRSYFSTSSHLCQLRPPGLTPRTSSPANPLVLGTEDDVLGPPGLEDRGGRLSLPEVFGRSKRLSFVGFADIVH